MSSPSTSLSLSRSVFTLVGIGAVLMAGSNLASGASLTDPVMPGGLALGGLVLGAAAWVEAPDRIRALVAWLGIAGVIVAIAIVASHALRTPSADVLALVGIPSLLILAAAARLGVARAARGALGDPARTA